MKKTLVIAALSLLLVACASNTLVATLTPGPVPTAQPTPGTLYAQIVSNTTISEDAWNTIPVLQSVEKGEIGLQLAGIWFYKPNGSTDTVRFSEGGYGNIYHSSSASDEYQVNWQFQSIRVKLPQNDVLEIGTVEGFTFYFRRGDVNQGNVAVVP